MLNAQRPRAIHVLLVEDNDGDVLLIRKALKDSQKRLTLHVVANGGSALKFVRANNPRPQLVILDLSLPDRTGAEVLQELKNDADLRAIPVVVFSSSGASADVLLAYRSHASGYIKKPQDVDEFFAAIASLERYWVQTVELP